MLWHDDTTETMSKNWKVEKLKKEASAVRNWGVERRCRELTQHRCPENPEIKAEVIEHQLMLQAAAQVDNQQDLLFVSGCNLFWSSEQKKENSVRGPEEVLRYVRCKRVELHKACAALDGERLLQQPGQQVWGGGSPFFVSCTSVIQLHQRMFWFFSEYFFRTQVSNCYILILTEALDRCCSCWAADIHEIIYRKSKLLLL